MKKPPMSWDPKRVVSAVAYGLCLVVLSLLGAGVFDRWLSEKLPEARADRVAESDRDDATELKDASSSGGETTASARPVYPSSPSSASSASPSSSVSLAPSSAIAPDAPPPLYDAEGRLNLNVATVVELDKLPGVGPSKAEAIVALRAKLGGKFKKLEDLLRVKGIKRKFLEKLRPKVVLVP